MRRLDIKKKANQFLVRIIPFLGLGVFLVLLAVGLVVFSYLLVLGAVVGVILFGAIWVYNRFFNRKRKLAVRQHTPNRAGGRTIDHEEFK